MCQFSLEGYKTRDAVEGETLYAASVHSGAFTTDPRRRIFANSMVCIKYGQICTLDNLQLMANYAGRLPRKVNKRYVVELGRNDSRLLNGDVFVFEDGYRLPSYFVTSPIYVGVKVEHEKAMARIEEAVDEAIATIPSKDEALVS
jgi:hypothetical protein